MKLFLFFLLTLGFPLFLSAQSIQIQNKVTIQKSKILLGDIAKFNGLSQEDQKNIEGIEIAPAPLTGTIQQFPKSFLQQKLSQVPSHITIKYPNMLSVAKENKTIQPFDLSKELERILRDRYQDQEIQEIKLPTFKPILLEDEQAYQWFISEQDNQYQGKQLKITLQSYVLKDNTPIKNDVYFAQMTFLITVPVLIQKVNVGKTIQPQDIGNIKIPDRELPIDCITAVEDLYGAQLKQNIPLNTPMSKQMLNLPIIIKRGESVEMRFKKKGISLVIQGEAMSQGRKGDKIQIKNISSQKIVSARIIGPGQVLVE
jgi:flagella basal body P-ring formation protein FlgA